MLTKCLTVEYNRVYLTTKKSWNQRKKRNEAIEIFC
jgi:hypothetical protein